MQLQGCLKAHQWSRHGLLRYQDPAVSCPLMQRFDVAEVGSDLGLSLDFVKDGGF
jgi:hypothetical protein